VAVTAVELPTWFGPEERPLAGWLTLPEDRRVRGAVVICTSVGEEARSVRRTLRELALRLAEAGFLAFRFDYDGTGDSAGDFDDAGSPGRWSASVGEALGFVAGLGCRSVSLVGIRMGATIAAVAAAQHGQALDALVLWDPCQSGRTFLREQSMLYRAMDSSPHPGHDGDVVLPGYVLGAEAAAALSALHVDDALTLDRDRTALVLAYRDDRPRPSALIERFEAAGATVFPVAGHAALLNISPLDAVPPVDAMSSVVRAVSQAVGGDRQAVEVRTRSHATVPTPWGDVVESFERIGRDGLFGIATETADGSGEVEAVFVNVANESHIGPARMWVTLARRWAADAGVPGLRFDFGGLGDSPDVEGRPRDTTYDPRAIDDLDDAIDEVAARGRRAVLVGLCSSAYAAFEGALRRRVAGTIVTNPILETIGMTTTNRDPVTGDPRRKALREWPQPLFRFAVKHLRIATTLWRTLQHVRPRKAAMGVVADVMRRDSTVFLALGEGERGPFDANLYWRLREPAMRRSGRFERVDIPTLDHSALVADGRGQLERAMNRHVLEHHAARAGARDSSTTTADSSRDSHVAG
jgi:pimeloyl-ACP methyl ester carboxylesterase